MLGVILCCWVLFSAIRKKAYRYIPIALLTILYIIMAGLSNIYSFHDILNILSVLEKTALILVFVISLLSCTKRDTYGKIHPIPAVFSGLTCAVRFFRTFVFHRYTEKLMHPGADVLKINDEFTLSYNLCNSLTAIFIFMMLVYILWQLHKIKNESADASV